MSALDISAFMLGDWKKPKRAVPGDITGDFATPGRPDYPYRWRGRRRHSWRFSLGIAVILFLKMEFDSAIDERPTPHVICVLSQAVDIRL